MVKLWMRKYDQQNLSRFPPANGGYAGVQPTFKTCAPTRSCSQEKSPHITAVLRGGEPRRRNAPTSPLNSDERHAIVFLRRTEATPEYSPHLSLVLRREPARRRRARKLPLFSGVGSLAGGTRRIHRSTPMSGTQSFSSGKRRLRRSTAHI
jgi:hypothetical protein